MRNSTLLIVFVGLSLLASANTQSTVSNAASQGQAVAKSALGTVSSAVKAEGQDVVKIVTAVLKQVLGDANYKKLMALIANLVKQIQAAAAGVQKSVQGAVAGIQKQMGGASSGSTKPILDLWQELNTQSTVSGAAKQGAAVAKSAAATVGKDLQKELNDVIKIAEAVLKKVIGDGNYKQLMAMLQKLMAAVQGAVKKLQTSAQGAIGGIQKAMSGKAILFELSTQSTIQGAAKAGAATAQSAAKTLGADAQKELNLVVKVLEAILKKVLGDANYKQLMAMINQLIAAAKNAAGQIAQKAQGAVKQIQGAVAGIQKQMAGSGAKPVFGFLQDLSTASTVQGAAKAGAATAQSAGKTLMADAQKELNLLVKVLEALLKQVLGDANYKQLMAMINQLIAQLKAAAGKAQAAAGQAVKQIQGAVAGIQKQMGGAAASGKPIFDLYQEANAQSTIQSAAKAGAATAQSAGKTLAADAQKELGLLVKVLEAVLKQIVGEANYKKIMAMIGQVVAQLKKAAGQAQAAAGQAVQKLQGAIAGIQKQMGGSAKPFVAEFAELSTASTVQGAAKAGAATAQSAAKTLAADAQKELNLLVKVLEAVLKQLLGDANYKKLMAMIGQLMAQVKAAAGKAQAAVAGIAKQAQAAVAGLQKGGAGGAAASGGKPIFDLYQEANAQSTIQSAAKAGAATAQSAGKTLAADAQKEIGLVVKVLEAVLKQIVGEANYKKIMAMIGQLVAQLKAAAGKAQAAAGQAVKQLQGAVAGIQKQMGAAASGSKPIDFQELSTASTVQGAAKAGAATAQSAAKTLAADAQKELNLVVKVLEAVLKKILGENNYKQLMAMINQLIVQLKAAAGKAQAAAGGLVKQVQGAVAGIQKQMGGAAASGSKPVVQELGSTCAQLLALKAPKTRCDCFQNVKYCWDYDFTELKCGSC